MGHECMNTGGLRSFIHSKFVVGDIGVYRVILGVEDEINCLITGFHQVYQAGEITSHEVRHNPTFLAVRLPPLLRSYHS